jgi:predicted alpha-1,6-mannanase (GH76 family)
MVEDVYLRTKSASHKTLITNLLNTFLQQNQGSGGLYDWNWNDYNDDLQWAGIAFARGYQITGNVTFLNQAKYAFNRSYDRGWTTELGGGLWWDVSHQDKSGLSNNPEIYWAAIFMKQPKRLPTLQKLPQYIIG